MALQVPKVKLGSQGLEVSRIGLGCAGLSGVMNDPLSHEEGGAFLEQVFHRGVTFFDTANLYGLGDNEIMIGKALKRLPREQVQLSTKFGVVMSDPNNIGVKGTPEYVRECLEDSLKRLDADYIDIYFQHRVDSTVPIEETMGELKKLVEEGKIKYIGLSEAGVDTIKRAHAVHPISAVQMEYSLWSREIEEDVIPLCRELGIGIVAYSPLGHGFFGGRGILDSFPSDSFMNLNPRFMGENLENNKVLFSKFSNLAAKHSCTSPQLALAWLYHQGIDIIPIPGTTKMKNLESNIQAMAIKLTQEDLDEILDTVRSVEIIGERDVVTFMKFAYKLTDTPNK